MVQSVRCIKFGEILLDENLRTILLCTNCHMDYRTMEEFRQHFDYCSSSGGQSTQGICGGNVTLVLPRAKDGSQAQHLLGRYKTGSKEFLVYKFNGLKSRDVVNSDVRNNHHDDDFMDLIKIEEELLDPRWYTEINDNQVDDNDHHQTPSYNELVEAVTPFVQFKENLKTNNDCKQRGKRAKEFAPATKSNKNKKHFETHEIPSNPSISPLKTYTNTKRRISYQKQSPIKEPPNSIQVGSRPVQVVDNLPIQVAVGAKSGSLAAVNGHAKQKLPIQKSHRMKLLTTNTSTPMATATESRVNGNVQVLKTETIPVPSNIGPVVKTVPTEILCRAATNGTTLNNVSAPPKSMRTEQILNKLQTLGLQVKRKHPIEQQQPPPSRNPEKEKAMELVKKLQSKGMNVKIIQANPKVSAEIEEKKPRLENVCANGNYGQLGAKKPQLNRNLTIKKVK